MFVRASAASLLGLERKIVLEFSSPITYEKGQRAAADQMLIKGMKQKDDAWYWIDYEVLSDSEDLLFHIGANRLGRLGW